MSSLSFFSPVPLPIPVHSSPIETVVTVFAFAFGGGGALQSQFLPLDLCPSVYLSRSRTPTLHSSPPPRSSPAAPSPSGWPYLSSRCPRARLVSLCALWRPRLLRASGRRRSLLCHFLSLWIITAVSRREEAHSAQWLLTDADEQANNQQRKRVICLVHDSCLP